MQFIRLDSIEPRTKYGSSSIVILERKINQNINNLIEYRRRTTRLFDNSHYLSMLLSNITNYIAHTPKQTYDNIEFNLRYITDMFNIAYIGESNGHSNAFLGNDYLFQEKKDVSFDNNGLIVNSKEPVSIYRHESKTLRVEDFFDGDEVTNSMIGLDIPLIGAKLHTEYLNANKEDRLFNSDIYLTKMIYNKEFISNIVNQSLLNRFNDLNTKIERENYKVLPYTHDDVYKEFKESINDYKSYFKSISGDKLETLIANLPLIGNNNTLIANLNDLYRNNLMFINAVVEVSLLDRLYNIMNISKGNIDISSYERRLERLLGGNRFGDYLTHLSLENKLHYTNILKRKK